MKFIWSLHRWCPDSGHLYLDVYIQEFTYIIHYYPGRDWPHLNSFIISTYQPILFPLYPSAPFITLAIYGQVVRHCMYSIMFSCVAHPRGRPIVLLASLVVPWGDGRFITPCIHSPCSLLFQNLYLYITDLDLLFVQSIML